MRYQQFKENKLDKVINDMNQVKTIVNGKMAFDRVNIKTCSFAWWLLHWYKFQRYCFLANYYYITPYLILIF